MDTVSIKMEPSFAQEMERVMKEYRYATKTEFIREAIREKMLQLNGQYALLRLYGTSTRNTSDSRLHRAGERAARDVERWLAAHEDTSGMMTSTTSRKRRK